MAPITPNTRLIQLPPRDWDRCLDLFADLNVMRCVLESAFRSRCDEMWVDELTHPTLALLDGCYYLLGGRPSAILMDAIKSIILPGCLFVAANKAWRDVFDSSWSADAVRMERWYFPDQQPKIPLRRTLPRGIEITRLREEEISRFEASIDIHFRANFAGLSEFIERGFLYVLKRKDRMIAAAGTFAMSEDSYEMAVYTLPEARRRGYARAVSTAALEHGRSIGLTAAWDASTPTSRKLAHQLGFEDEYAYTAWRRRSQAGDT